MSTLHRDRCRHQDGSLWGRCVNCGMTWDEQLAKWTPAPVYEFPTPRDPQTYTARINGHEVLVTIWPAGLAQVAERADSGESWSAPETLTPVETVESEHTTPWRTEGPS